MKLLEVVLTDQVASELDVLIKNGWFASEAEVVRAAVLEFVRHNRFALAEQFQREDIAWALAQKKTRS